MIQVRSRATGSKYCDDTFKFGALQLESRDGGPWSRYSLNESVNSLSLYMILTIAIHIDIMLCIPIGLIDTRTDI